MNPTSVSKTICDLAPRAVINAAAYTAVDQAEDEPAICEAINARAVQVALRPENASASGRDRNTMSVRRRNCRKSNASIFPKSC